MGKCIDLTGQKFGKLTVVERCGSKSNNSLWKCVCECGNESIVMARSLNSGHTKTCGKCKREPKQRIDMIGNRFGRLTVVAFDHECEVSSKHKKLFWLCECDCGNKTVVEGWRLRSGGTKSCGCLMRETSAKNIKKLNARHSSSVSITDESGKQTRLYMIWGNMKARCQREYSVGYEYYGGRGIRVCDEWMEYAPFHKWAMDSGYQPDLTLDRIDVNGNYCPDNCRWATRKQQANNTRRNCNIEIDGVVHTAAEWSEISGIKAMTIRRRIRVGWDDRDAVFAPLHKKYSEDSNEQLHSVSCTQSLQST